MYNEAIKISFVSELETTKKGNCIRLFEAMATEEERRRQDLYCFSKEEVGHFVIKTFSTFNVKGFYDYMTNFKSYQKWALAKGFIPADYKFKVYEKFNVSEFFYNNINYQIFLNPGQLKSFLEEILIYDENDSYEKLSEKKQAKAFFALIYQGFTEKEVISLKCENVKRVGYDYVVLTNNKVSIIYDEFHEYIKEIDDESYNLESRTFFLNSKIDRNKLPQKYKKYFYAPEKKYHIDEEKRKALTSTDLLYMQGMTYRYARDKNMLQFEEYKDDLIKRCFGRSPSQSNLRRIESILSIFKNQHNKK